MRTNDVIEFVGDGVADLGITGVDLLTETGAELPKVRELGYGHCRLAAAVPSDTPYQSIADLAGLRVATAHPNTARRYFAEQRIPVDVIPISGAVEVAPRLGLAEAIVDLVSTGSTLVMNGLRPIGDILASEALLVANPTALVQRAGELTGIDTMIGAVIAARGRKYVMMNAPADKLVELEALLPGLESPSVIPLAHGGMIAIHSVVAPTRSGASCRASRRPGRRASSSCPSRRSSRDPAPALRLWRLDLRATPPDRAAHDAWAKLTRRGAVPDTAVRTVARAILDEVRTGGAAAVTTLSERYGGGRADGSLLLDAAILDAARDALPVELRDALEAAIANVRRFAEAQRPAGTAHRDRPGRRARAALDPASERRLLRAGRRRAVPVVADHDRRPRAGRRRRSASSSPPPPIATAPSTRSLPEPPGSWASRRSSSPAAPRPSARSPSGCRKIGLAPVDRIVGPGNAWVTAAKLEVAGEVAIDLPAGPSEGLVLADAHADPRTVAVDLITQAEHGPDSPAILVTTDEALADAVEVQVNERLATTLRRAVLERALGGARADRARTRRGPGHRPRERDAPEHLSIDVADPEAAAARITDAGSVFVGRWAPESAGDYATGANHVLPTGGLARACGPLAVETFGKFLQVQRLTRAGLATLRPTIRALAEAEGLHAHRDAVEARFTDDR